MSQHTLMKYWRRSVKNRITNARFLAFVFAAASLALMIACQTVELPPYTKYNADADVPRISLEEAKKDYDAGIAVFIDSRAESQYNQEHIAGSMPITKVGPIEDNYPGIPRGKKIIVYCS